MCWHWGCITRFVNANWGRVPYSVANWLNDNDNRLQFRDAGSLNEHDTQRYTQVWNIVVGDPSSYHILYSCGESLTGSVKEG